MLFCACKLCWLCLLGYVRRGTNGVDSLNCVVVKSTQFSGFLACHLTGLSSGLCNCSLFCRSLFVPRKRFKGVCQYVGEKLTC